MSTRIVGRRAYVDTASEALDASILDGVDDVVISDHAEVLKLERLLRAVA